MSWHAHHDHRQERHYDADVAKGGRETPARPARLDRRPQSEKGDMPAGAEGGCRETGPQGTVGTTLAINAQSPLSRSGGTLSIYSCTNLASVAGLGNLSGVRSIHYMFSSCAFTTIDFRGFAPSTLTDHFNTFSEYKSTTTILADSTWALPSSGISGSQCFRSCSTSLVGGANGTVWPATRRRTRAAASIW